MSRPNHIDDEEEAQRLLELPAEPRSGTGRAASLDENGDDETPCGNGNGNGDGNGIGNGMTRSQARNLFTSHFLSTWNARSYEFAAIIFTASTYPATLAASSTRGLVTTAALICLSSPLGRAIDRSPNRLKTLLATIAANRIAVLLASALWLLVVAPPDRSSPAHPALFDGARLHGPARDALFALVLALGVVERLSASGNMMAMERDWVVAVAAPEGEGYDLTRLNAAMRRIDLGCKLLAPIFISGVVSAADVRVGVVVVSGMSAVSWGVEVWCARRVYAGNESLRRVKPRPREGEGEDGGLGVVGSRGWVVVGRIGGSLRVFAGDFEMYFSSRVWIPSLALALLHLSVLAYSATFITYLLSIGFSLNLITVARAVGSVVEISSTVVTPFGVDYLGKGHHRHHDNDAIVDDEFEEPLMQDPQEEAGNTETGLERLGLWGITWQLINLVPVVLALWALSPPIHGEQASLFSRILKSATSLGSPTLLALTLFAFLSFSRLGLWIFDLTTQQLSQTLIPPHQRSSFAGVENSFVNVFEFCHHISVLILSRPEQFKYLATGSLAAVALSAAMYAGWVWRQRGHLVHWEKVAKGCECAKKRRSVSRSSSLRRRRRA